MPKKDITGQKFGKLTVIQETKQRASNGSILWECQCDCGNICYAVGSDLKSNRKISCGLCYKGEDLTGQKFNKLTVLGPTEKRVNQKMVWKCKCDCGNITYVHTANLKHGMVKSCGCLLSGGQRKFNEPKNLIGQKFGKLIVIEYIKSSKWKCLCDCGNIVIVETSNLISGNSTSCGCSKNFKGEQQIKQLLEKANLSFEIQKTFNNCIYPLTQGHARFDFYVNKQYLIEYDGIQHFQLLNSFYGQNPEELLELNQYRDAFKNQWCKENNIPLIRIPYTHLKDLCIEDLLLETTTFLVRE